jgi:hypothetical protein
MGTETIAPNISSKTEAAFSYEDVLKVQGTSREGAE